jgi:hypothetical protein
MLKWPIIRIVFVVLVATRPAFAGETRPAPTGFAALADAARLPTWSEPVRVQYSTFLVTLSPRAFALSPDGTYWAWQSGNENAMHDLAKVRSACRASLPALRSRRRRGLAGEVRRGV